ncbi:sporulation protein YabP [Caproicibacterium sp. NSD3]
MTEPEKNGKTPHSLTLENRHLIKATGVARVDSFDEETVVAYTDYGQLVIKGQKLKISELNMDTGKLSVEGEVVSMTYVAGREEQGGFFARLFR